MFSVGDKVQIISGSYAWKTAKVSNHSTQYSYLFQTPYLTITDIDIGTTFSYLQFKEGDDAGVVHWWSTVSFIPYTPVAPKTKKKSNRWNKLI